PTYRHDRDRPRRFHATVPLSFALTTQYSDSAPQGPRLQRERDGRVSSRDLLGLFVELPVILLIVCSVHAGRSLAVDCPRYAEAIYKHAEANRPERLLKRHFDGPFFRQCFKYTFCLCLVLEAKG